MKKKTGEKGLGVNENLEEIINHIAEKDRGVGRKGKKF